MKEAEMRSLSDEELLKISCRKTRKGTYTAEANRAMKIRRERACFWDDLPTRKGLPFDVTLLIDFDVVEDNYD